MKFKIKKISDFQGITEASAKEVTIPESDYSLFTSDDKFIQFERIEEEEKFELKEYPVKPGVFSIVKSVAGLELVTSSFSSDPIMDEYTHTDHITKKIDCFFERLDVYKKYGYDVPMRKMILFGPPGTGKSASVTKVANKYTASNDTLILIWHTDKFEPGDLKNFIKRFEYTKHGVTKMILVAEDLGGTEVDEGKMRSDSSLLSLLDNMEKTFKIPTFVLTTTNFPEMFLGNLMNRRGRIDDKVEVPYPSAEFRSKFLEFFTKGEASREALTSIQDKKYAEFSVADVKDIVIRSDLFDLTLVEAMEELRKDIEKYKKNFTKRSSLGFDVD